LKWAKYIAQKYNDIDISLPNPEAVAQTYASIRRDIKTLRMAKSELDKACQPLAGDDKRRCRSFV
jgi:hypothetical protein